MSSQSDILRDTPTVIVPAPPNEDRDIANIRSQKRSLLAQLQLKTGSAQQEAPTPEELLAQWPTNPHNDRDAASLIFQDFCRQREEDSSTNLVDYQDRFPEHKDSLASLLRQDDFAKSLSGSGSSPHFALPEVGDRLFGFRLLHELGRGSFARVFLASQDDLASRPVVLKVSNIEGDEPQTMALLQHTHIVPIHSVHEDKRAGLRAVCMPYFGGASLSEVLKKAGVGSVPVRTGAELVVALQAVQAPVMPGEHGGSAPLMAGDPKTLTILKGFLYPQAAAWIVARLAEGLQHSHSRGVLHRDVKPSNVLLGMDGQPMLLDFNLAQVTRGNQVRVVLGGTINYMAPEHLRSLVARDPAVARKVDHRADIYSLGMVLYEMLVGRRPFAESASYTPLPLLVEAMAVERAQAVPSLRQTLPNAPWDLESIIRKCLAPMPADRYQQAEHVAEDLQRFLDDRPLLYAPQLDLRERCRKWRRRHPRLTTAATVGMVAGFLLSILGAALMGSQYLLATTRSHLGDTREQLNRAEAQDLKRAFRTGTIRTLCLVNATTDTKDQLQEGRSACEKTLGIYKILDRSDWQQQPAWQYLEEADRQKLAEDVRELLLLLAWAHAAPDARDAAALRQALTLLDRCEEMAGLPPLRALWEDRALYLDWLGEKAQAKGARERAAGITPASARDHYLLATSLAKQGGQDRYADAIAELDKALRLNPDHYWSLMQRGICYGKREELLLAARDFGRCAGLEPDFAWSHYNLGYILDLGHKHEQAIASYSAAIRCDNNYALAYLNRGLSLLDLKRFQAALEDFDQALVLGRDDAVLHHGRGMALESLGKFEQADAAFALALARVGGLPHPTQIKLLLRHGFTVYKRLPDAAEKAFEEVLRQEAHQPQALYGKAMVFEQRGKEEDAIVCFDEALQWHPSFVAARRFRAVLLARKGGLANLGKANADINICLMQEEQAGVTLYAAACVLALAAEKNGDVKQRKQQQDEAIHFLTKAFQQGYGLAGAAIDRDLRSLYQHPQFQKQLLRSRPDAPR